MKHVIGITFLILVIIGNLLPEKVHATDGYFGVGYGAQNKGLAGAGTAWYKNGLINGNPAGNVFLGKKYLVGFEIFNPNREYTILGNPSGMEHTMGLTPGTVVSGSKAFLEPTLGANWMINEKSSFSATLFGNGGMNTDYKTKTFYDQGSETTGINLAQMFLGLTYSRKIAEKHSLGVTALVVYQYFSATGVATFASMSQAPTKVSGNGTDNGTGFGFKIGYMGQLADGLTLGINYQPKIVVAKFSKYAGLFAEQGNFDIPSNLSAGLAYELNKKWAILADYKRINYTGVASVSNSFDPMSASLLGSDKGAGFGWKDINVYKMGVEFSGNNGWTLRGGYSHSDQPVQKSQTLFNILAPAVTTDHLTIGFSKQLGASKSAVHFALVYALPGSVSGYNPMDFDATQAIAGNMVPNQTINLKMNQLEFEVAFTF